MTIDSTLAKFYFIFTVDKNEFTECLLKRCDRSNIITLHNKYLIDKKRRKKLKYITHEQARHAHENIEVIFTQVYET